jgi:2-methylisocitrate lyase-like PEP mutase family enzyme
MSTANLKQAKKAETLRALHSGGEPLLLPNVWDAASARIVEDAGYPALATTSAGVAFTLGYPDGQKISRDEMLGVIQRIANVAAVPVSADVEGGYGPRPEDSGRTARALIEAGAVGLNLEDATGDASNPLFELPLQLEKIRAVREASSALGVPLVLNARTDVYLWQVGKPETWYDASVKRLSAYRDAGADCVFVPGLSDGSTIGRMVADLRCPVNILAGPGSPSVPELKALGVARISLGSSPMRATLGVLRRVATELKLQGTYESMADAPSHGELNALIGSRAPGR